MELLIIQLSLSTSIFGPNILASIQKYQNTRNMTNELMINADMASYILTGLLK